MEQHFGKLTSLQQMEKYYQKMRGVSRAQLLANIYKTDGKLPQQKIQKDLTEAFLAITQNYNFDPKQPIVQQILKMFNIKAVQIQGKTPSQRQIHLKRKILEFIQERLKNLPGNQQVVEYNFRKNNPQNNLFEWVGVKSKFQNLRSIFQQILLQKVKLFDQDLSRLTQMQSVPEDVKQQLAATARTRNFGYTNTSRTLNKQSRVKSLSTITPSHQRRKQIQKNGFTNVLIRDKSQFSLKKWTKQQQKLFQHKKKQFTQNFNKNNNQIPVIFQFVKKYTKTVKARDNIFQKWENRQKNGITAEELRYLCSTSLFLNRTLNKSEKDRLNRNIKSLGKQLISRLQFNIAQKIIQTYKQFMKKVADLRAHYYEQLTEKRKTEYNQLKKKEVKNDNLQKRRKQFLKFKKIFQNICNSQKMKIILNPKVYRWVNLFIKNLKNRYQQKTGKKLYEFKEISLFNRLKQSRNNKMRLISAKTKYPSARIIKRQDIGTMRQPMKKYVQTQRFFYDKTFQNRIQNLNSVKYNNQKSFRSHLSGGPKRKSPNLVSVNLQKRQIVLTSNYCLQAIIKLQAKWRSIRERKHYLSYIQQYRQDLAKDFEQRKASLKYIYPLGIKFNLKAIQDRLKRVSMRTLNIIKPYFRVAKKPINNYTSFSKTNFPLPELKVKYSKNSSRRLAEFRNFVKNNQYQKLFKSGIVVTSKQINQSTYLDGQQQPSAMWWAVKNSNVDLTKMFLEGGGNPNSKNWEGSTCLHEAIQNGDVQIIFLLLDYGADLNIKNNKRCTPLYFATKKMLQLLGLQEATVEVEQGSKENSKQIKEALKDNNSLYYKPSFNQNFYVEHYY